jgi:hypothetical protein
MSSRITLSEKLALRCGECEIEWVNSLCPCKLLTAENNNDQSATGWLDSMLRYVVDLAHGRAVLDPEPRQLLIGKVVLEIQRSVPLVPILLTSDGDKMGETPRKANWQQKYAYLVDHVRDTDRVSNGGVHVCCGGSIHIIETVPGKKKKLHCAWCGLDERIPVYITTFEELRNHFESG